MLKYSNIFFIFLCLFFLKNEAFGTVYTSQEATVKYEDLKLFQPPEAEDGSVQTLDGRGEISPVLDEATTRFIERALGGKVLEIGGAYGKIMIETLTKDPTTVYHINDIDERHLFIAAHNLEMTQISQSARENVRFIPGDITGDLEFSDQYDAILAARVFHFFSPKQMTSAIQNIHALLKAGGRVYIVAFSPYVKRYQRFIPEYTRRRLLGEDFPGYVHSLGDWMSRSGDQLATPHEERCMFVCELVLSKLFKKNGFKIIDSKLVGLGYRSASFSLDGRENVILIAEKLSLTEALKQ